MKKFLDKFFPKEEINGAGTCPTSLFRWTLFSCRWGKLYLHHFIDQDWTEDPHNHPKNFISIGLRGWYYEHVYDEQGVYVASIRYIAPWIRRFPASHTHRIQTKNCWTLCLVGRIKQDWGFFYRAKPDSTPRWVRWDHYVKEFGKERKAC